MTIAAVNFVLTNSHRGADPWSARRAMKARPTGVHELIFAGELVRTSPPCVSMYARAGSAYSSSSGFSGQRQRRSRAGCCRTSRPARARRRRRCDVDRLVQRGDRQRLPQHLDETRRLPVAHEPFADGFRSRRGPCRRCRRRDTAGSGRGNPQRRDRSRQPSALHVINAAEQVERRRQRRAREARRAAVAIDHVDGQAILDCT